MSVFPVVLFTFALTANAYGPHHPRGHNHPRVTDGHTKLTQDKHILQDKEHIREDLQDVVSADITDKMSPEELEFYYFHIHDADNNTKLDGLEILRAVQHTTHEEEKNFDTEEAASMDQIIDLIDKVLAEDDLDKDGYLSYIEYVRGRSRDEKAHDANNNIRYS